MIKKFLVISLFIVSIVLGATPEEIRLEKALTSLQSSDEVEQFRGYNECKAIYTKATSAKNTALIKSSLEGIVKGGELLRIDVAKYKSQLEKYSPPSVESPALVVASRSSQVVEVVQKPLEFPKEYLKTPSSVIVQESPKVNTPIAIFPIIKTPEIQRILLESKIKENSVELFFDSTIDPKEVRLSKIIESDKQRFRYIVDIDNIKIAQTKIFDVPIKIRLAQYDTKTLRMVIESSNAIAIKPLVRGKSILIDLSGVSTKSSQVQSASPTTVSPEVPSVAAPLVVTPPLQVPPPLVVLPPRDRSKKVIVIDPGHGGKDSGAVGNGHMEKEIVLQISLSLAQRLRSIGYVVYLTRESDFFVELKDRTRFANDKMSDLFLSIHANSIAKGSDVNAAYGVETYFLSPGRSERAMRVAAKENYEDMGEMGAYGKLSFLNVLNSEKIIASNKLAIDIQKGVLNSLRQQYPNVKDNGAREAPFWVLVGAQMPAILLEVGYISHPEESNRIADTAYQKEMVEGIVGGVKHYFANNQ
jgi:N-acetylmuramoyl-L-alanine amidase